MMEGKPGRYGRLGIAGFAGALLLASLFNGVLPRAASAQGTKYYFNGQSTDQANKLAGTPTATFNTTTPTGTTDILQTGPPVANIAQSENPLTTYWVSNAITGTVSGDIHFDWWWSVQNPTDLAFQNELDINVFANVTGVGTGTLIGSAKGVSINAGAGTPDENANDVAISGTGVTNLVIEVTQHFVNGGMTDTAHYGSTSAPSGFTFPYTPPAGGTPPPVTAGTQFFANTGAYESPPGYQSRDALQRNNAGEPSIGADWQTTVTGNNVIMYMAGTQVSKVTFDTSTKPPTPTWNDVTPAQISAASEDSILFTDHAFIGSQADRTWAEDFLINAACNALLAHTDAPADGGPGGGPTSTAVNAAWTQDGCPDAEGPDHPSLGAGHYSSFTAGPPTACTVITCYPDIVYYCSQNIVQNTLPGAECNTSYTGGQTWNTPTEVFGDSTPCGAIHGHIRVAPDGTMYVPQNNCSGGHQGMARTQDNGATYTYRVVPDSTAPAASTGTDPSLDSSSDNTLYYGYEDGGGHPKIAVSFDHGNTWGTSADVGTPFGITNSKFPEVIAGDGGRAAFAFLGANCPSTQTGCSAGDQSPNFTGVWYLYVAFTYDHGASWQVVNATPGNPVQRGCIWNGGGTNPCRNLLDFNDITVDHSGHVYVAYTDGCTVDPQNTFNCNTYTGAPDSSGCPINGMGNSENASEYSTQTCTYGRQSALVRQVCGVGLFAANDPGFFEDPSCATNPNGTPEAPTVAGIAIAGVTVVGIFAIGRRRRRKGGLQIAG